MPASAAHPPTPATPAVLATPATVECTAASTAEEAIRRAAADPLDAHLPRHPLHALIAVHATAAERDLRWADARVSALV